MTAAATGIHYVAARSVTEALDLMRQPGSRIVAGGTALQLEWARGFDRPQLMIGLSALPEFQDIKAGPETIRIGALVTLASLAKAPSVARHLPLLLKAVGNVAGPGVRNLATVGGNVAGRTGCLLPPLLALDATAEFETDAGRRVLPLIDWLALPVETAGLLLAIHVPVKQETSRWTTRKIGLRAAFTPSMIGVAGVLEMDGDRIVSARLAAGGGVVPPQRLARAEARLAGLLEQQVDWAAIRSDLADEIVAPDDAFRTGRYRRRAGANVLVAGLSRQGSVSVLFPDYAALAEPTDPTLLSRETAADRWFMRPDGPAKIDATLAYLTDHRPSGALVGRILRARHPHARILSIDTGAAEAIPGVAAVVTHRDIPGETMFGTMGHDQPVFCSDRVRYVGDVVAAVAAIDRETADRALAAIRVDYELLTVITDAEAALEPDAVPLHPDGNLRCEFNLSRGDLESAFARAAHVVEDVYVLPRQMHGFLETEGGHAFVDEAGMLHMLAGGQNGPRDREELARILAMPEEKIRVVTSPTGGGFGGKDELTVQPALALLAIKTGRPVRLHLDRVESVDAGLKRHPMTIRMKTGIDANGQLVAQSVDVVADAGAYASLGPAVLETAMEHAAGPYRIDNIETRGRLAYTNNGVGGAFRGFGANQMAFAVECQMDRLAALCGLDPVEIRRRNLRPPGEPGFLGQRVAPSDRMAEMLEAASSDPLWQQPRGPSADGETLFGVGMALNLQGNGLGTMPPDVGGGRLVLSPDGRIQARFGLDEMGQGMVVAVQAAFAEALGCSRDDVEPVLGDTALVPDSGSSSASRGTYVVWKAAQMTTPDFTRQMREAAGLLLGRDPATLVIGPGGIAERGSNSGALLLSFPDLARQLAPSDLPDASARFEFPKADYRKGNARYIFCYGATLVRVAICRATGTVAVTHLVQHTAAGPVLDASSYLAQIEGGGIQGLGFTLTEHAAMESGRYITTNLDSYIMPGIADAPATMRTHALEGLDPGDPYGPRGVGELGIGAVTPAIANAIADAIGNWPARLPVEPEWVLDRIEGQP